MHIEYMRAAIREAVKAESEGEVPIGAVIVKDGEILAAAHNMKENWHCAVHHAEIVAIERACEAEDNWHLDGCDIYVTLEPCPMCAGAIINSRIRKVYFGAYDPKAGCCGTLYNLCEDKRFNHRPEVEGGVLEEECAELLTEYFRRKRNEIKSERRH